MQTTTFTPFALRGVLREINAGHDVAGYTTNPERPLPGLFVYARGVPRGSVVGYMEEV